MRVTAASPVRSSSPRPLPMPARRVAWAVLLVAVLLAASPAFAQWSEDPAQNLTVADRSEGQTQPKIAPTDDGGFYVSWFGGGGDGYDVYLQRLDADGVAQWADDGIRVADRSFSSTEDYGLAVDADGNALLAFRVADGDGRAQAVASLVSPSGDFLWGEPGVFVSDDPSAAASPRVAGIPGGGAVVAWTSFSNGGIVVQKLDAAGAPQWGADGVSLSTPTGFFFLADLHADDAGNAIVSGSAQLSNFDRRLWAQKLASADGAPLWGSDPVEVFDGSDGALQFGYFPPFVPDGSGGAVFAWYQVGGIGEGRVRVQRVLADGSAAFPQNGVEATAEADRQRTAPSAAFNEATGDVFVVWPEELQVGQTRTFGVSAQRIDAAGARQWGDDGQPLVPLGDAQASQVSALALGAGAVFAWSLGSAPAPMQIESARLDADGGFVWPDEIVPLKTAATSNTRMRGALSSLGFAAYVWADDSGDGSNPDAIKAQNVSADGALGPIETSSLTYLYDDGDGDTNQGPPSTFDPDMLWGNYYLTQPGGEILTEISVAFGPTFPSLANGPVTFWLLDDPDADFDPRNATALTSVEATPDVFNDNFFTVGIPPTQVSGAFFVGVSAQLLGGQDRPARVDTDADGDRSWFFYAPDIAAVIDDLASAPFGTRMDNPEFVIFPGAFMIRATGQLGEAVGSVASLDATEVTLTLAPGETASAGISLSNLGNSPLVYAVTVAQQEPAGDDSALTVEPDSGSVAAGVSESLTLLADAATLTEGTYTFDVLIETNDPQQPALNVAVTLVVTGGVATEDGATPGAFALRPSYPNPFEHTSTVEFDLPQRAHVTLAVYDVTGRRVATLVDRELEAGTHRATWDAAGMAAGTYLYRMQARAFAQTHRTLLVR
ncbi:MAG: T9SS type A sorting domain-containing protein [Rhodothermales bacterium]